MNDNLNDIHANCEEETAALRSQLRELQAQLDYEQERNLNSAANAQLQIKELTVERDNWYDACIRAHTRIAELTAEITRLREGGCARDQHTTQYCGEMQKLTAALAAAIDVIERYARLDAASWGASLKEQNKHARGATEHFRAAISGEGER